MRIEDRSALGPVRVVVVYQTGDECGCFRPGNVVAVEEDADPMIAVAINRCTNDNLVADLEFAKVKGEIAAFHPGGFDKAVLAVSLQKLGFGDLVPLQLCLP